MKTPKWQSGFAKLPDWQTKAAKLPVFDPRKFMQQFQGPKGAGQGFWGKLAPKMSPTVTRKKS